MYTVAFIDPYIKSPAIHCFNAFVKNFKLPTSYYTPASSGLKDLIVNRTDNNCYIVVGSASHVTEPLQWHTPLAEFLLEELKEGKPVLGCCFGHQLLCHALGSVVDYKYEDQEKVTGVREITIRQKFWDYELDENFTLPVGHKQVVKELGPDLLCVGEGLPNDIIMHKYLPLLTTQAHPEASSYFLCSDIQGLTEETQKLARRDGQAFIRRFLEHFRLIYTPHT